MTPAATLAELADRLDLDEHDLEHILLDSQRLGLVQRDEHGAWGLTPGTERRYGRALRAIGAAASGDSDGGRGMGRRLAGDDPASFREENRGETVSNTAGRGRP